MLKKICGLIVLSLLLLLNSGCALLATAVSAGISYGIYQATRK